MNLKSKGKMLIPAWIQVIVLLEKNKPLTASSIANISPAHTYNIIRLFEKKDILITTKLGRVTVVSFTKKGYELLEICKRFMDKVDELSLTNSSIGGTNNESKN